MVLSTISLLSFLKQEGNTLFLDIAINGQQASRSETPLYPFRFVDNARKFSQVIEGRIAMSPSERILPLFLLKQRDDYLMDQDPTIPCTNTTIETLWHRTVRAYSAGAHDQDVMMFPGQRGAEGPVYFRSLFFCTRAKAFFHPPCPECGSDLVLCTDDRLLNHLALPPFSTSLNRYLYCNNCRASKDLDGFYQFSRAKGEAVFVNDRFNLVQRFNRLKGVVNEHFPCTDCRWFSECHVTGRMAVDRIAFFAFYPFQMVAMKAFPLQAPAFLKLVSGATLQDVRVHADHKNDLRTVRALESMDASFQGKSGLFFPEGNRSFLEVLFLKLRFTCEAARALKRRSEALDSPVLDITANSIWIKPEASFGLMPWLWGGRVRLVDLPDHQVVDPLSAITVPGSHFHCLASLWFYTFLVNRHQTMEMVYEQLKPVFRLTGQTGACPDNIRKLIEEHPVLSPVNAVWRPPLGPLPEAAAAFWDRIVSIGLMMQTGESRSGIDQQLDGLIETIETLLMEIRDLLFSESQDLPSAGTGNAGAVDQSLALSPDIQQEVAMVLRSIRAQWMPPFPPADDDTLETVVLSSSEDNRSTDHFQSHLDKTVVLSPDELKQIRESAVQSTVPVREASPGDGFDDLEKTLVLSPIRSGGRNVRSKSGNRSGNKSDQGVFHSMQRSRP